MRVIGICVTICLLLAALKAAATVLALAVVAAIVISAIAHPKATLGWLAGFTLLGVMERAPLVVGIPLTLLAVVGWFEKCRGRNGEER